MSLSSNPLPPVLLTAEDIQKRTALVNQFHIIAHALGMLNFDGTYEVFRELYGAIIGQREVNRESFVSCEDAGRQFDRSRGYDQYKTDALGAIAQFEQLPQTDKYKGQIAECVTRLNNPSSLFSKQTRAHAAIIQTYGLSEDARPVPLPGGRHGFVLNFGRKR